MMTELVLRQQNLHRRPGEELNQGDLMNNPDEHRTR
jgi:hypothetical protein